MIKQNKTPPTVCILTGVIMLTPIWLTPICSAYCQKEENMKKRTTLILIFVLCIASLTATAIVTAMQISLDSPASLPSDI